MAPSSPPERDTSATTPASPAPPSAGDAGPVVCRQMPRRIEALGIAVELLFPRPPFSNFKFGPIVSMLRGQILRGHYLVAFRGLLPVGYSGWAECSREVGDRWLRESYSPTYQDCVSGECMMVMTVAATHKDAAAALTREMRLRYPNRYMYFKREYRDGKARKVIIFNRSAASSEAPATAGGAA